MRPASHRPAPDHFLRRLLAIGFVAAALIVLWQALASLQAWLPWQDAAPRTVTPRGDLAADEKAEVLENPPHE